MNNLQIGKPRFNKKILLFIAGGIAVLVALAFGGLWYMSSQASAEYAAQVQKVRGDIKATLADATSRIQAAKETGSKETAASVLAELATSLEAELDVVPVESYLLGIPLISQGAKDNKEQLIVKTRVLADALTDANALVAYQKNVLEQVLKVQDLTGKTQAEQEAMAASWAALVEQLDAMTPPESAATIHAKLTALATSIRTILATLPGLTSAKDGTGFTTKENELKAKIVELQGLGVEYQTASKVQDAALAEAYTGLAGLLD